MSAPTPPPRRVARPTSLPTTPDPEPTTWRSRLKARSNVWGKIAVDKGVQWSDSIGGKVNNVSEQRFGTEAFWPVTGDFPKEMDKAARILQAFTVDGVVTEDTKTDEKKQKKVIRKIPPEVIAQSMGLAIFTSMRSGIAPFGGAGGAGIVIAKLADGTWSGPASISPNNLSTGFLLGVDVYDCVLVIRSQKALDSFATHKATLGAEIGLAAGPYGAGAAMEAGKEGAPVFSYIRSRGIYAGLEIVGQVFVERAEENASMYHWPGIKAGDILSGKARVPVEAARLHQAIRDAESGRAQREKGDALDIVVVEGTDDVELHDGEVLKLPPTPDMTDGTEYQSDPETERVRIPSLPASANPSTTDIPAIKLPPPPRRNVKDTSTDPSSPKMKFPPPPRRNVNPSIPPRSLERPALSPQHSLVFQYSEAENAASPSLQDPFKIPPVENTEKLALPTGPNGVEGNAAGDIQRPPRRLERPALPPQHSSMSQYSEAENAASPSLHDPFEIPPVESAEKLALPIVPNSVGRDTAGSIQRPPRRLERPALPPHHSSTSHYSDAEDATSSRSDVALAIPPVDHTEITTGERYGGAVTEGDIQRQTFDRTNISEVEP